MLQGSNSKTLVSTNKPWQCLPKRIDIVSVAVDEPWASVARSTMASGIQVCKAAILVLLIGRICRERHGDDVRCHDIHTKLLDDLLRHASNVKVFFFPNSLRGYSVGVTDGRDL
jgi:hypothetical protein